MSPDTDAIRSVHLPPAELLPVHPVARRLGLEVAAHQARGDLVPDQIVLDLLTPVVVEAAARGGFILDGFPRTLPQATRRCRYQRSGRPNPKRDIAFNGRYGVAVPGC